MKTYIRGMGGDDVGSDKLHKKDRFGGHLPLLGGDGRILRATFGLLRSEREQALLRLVPSAVPVAFSGVRSSSATTTTSMPQR